MVDELERDGESTADLVREAIAEVKELTKLEVALAKDEAISEVKELKVVAIVFGVAFLVAVFGVTFLIVSLSLAIGGWVFPLVTGVILLVAAVLGALFGTKHLPKSPLWSTRQRLTADVRRLKERVA